mmetsp:Transcript_16206/g.26429  ORF Transcript_16206/g.26429 Transcript_16206/m.26429 type:complete len:278 (-) Transcript_16206:581-1414(-)
MQAAFTSFSKARLNSVNPFLQRVHFSKRSLRDMSTITLPPLCLVRRSCSSVVSTIPEKLSNRNLHVVKATRMCSSNCDSVNPTRHGIEAAHISKVAVCPLRRLMRFKKSYVTLSFLRLSRYSNASIVLPSVHNPKTCSSSSTRSCITVWNFKCPSRMSSAACIFISDFKVLKLPISANEDFLGMNSDMLSPSGELLDAARATTWRGVSHSLPSFSFLLLRSRLGTTPFLGTGHSSATVLRGFTVLAVVLTFILLRSGFTSFCFCSGGSATGTGSCSS